MKRPSPRLLAGVIVVGIAVVLAGFLGWSAGPRYQGRSMGHWFPRIVWEGLAAESRIKERMESLQAAGPEVFPLLVAAAQVRDGRLARAFSEFRGRLPERAQRLCPIWVREEWIHGWVAGIVQEGLYREPMLRAYTNAYDSFPVALRHAISRATREVTVPRDPALRDLAVPLARRMLAETNHGLSLAGATELLAWARTDASLFPELVEACGKWPPGFVSISHAALSFVRSLAALGTNAAPFEPWLAEWARFGVPMERACAAATLPAIAPERHPWGPTMAAQLPHLGLAELAAIVPRYEDARLNPETRRGLLSAVASLLDPDDPAGLAMPPSRGPVPVSRPATNVVSLVLEFAKTSGTNAVVAAPYLARLARHPESEWSETSAEVLARLGPVAPATVPDMVSALTNAVAAPALVLLLASYGPEAGAALPRLREFMAGRLPEGVETLVAASPREQGGWWPERWTRTNTGPQIVPDIALRTGRTNEWPLPAELRGKTHLDWGGFRGSQRGFRMSPELMRRYGLVPKDTSDPGEPVPPVSLAELAAEAVRRIGVGEPGGAPRRD